MTSDGGIAVSLLLFAICKFPAFFQYMTRLLAVMTCARFLLRFYIISFFLPTNVEMAPQEESVTKFEHSCSVGKSSDTRMKYRVSNSRADEDIK